MIIYTDLWLFIQNPFESIFQGHIYCIFGDVAQSSVYMLVYG